MCANKHICAECSCWFPEDNQFNIVALSTEYRAKSNPLAAVIKARTKLSGIRGSQCNTPAEVSRVPGNAPCAAADSSFRPLGGPTRPF